MTSAASDSRRYLQRLRLESRRRSWEPASVLAAIARAIGERHGAPDDLALVRSAEPVDLDDLTPPRTLHRPSLLGDAHEALIEYGKRRRQGVYYTPCEVAGRLLAAATSGWPLPKRPRVCDPASGGGSFLLAAGGWLESLGFARETIVAELLWGVDVDPLAAQVTESVLVLWARERGVDAQPHIVVADSLRSGLEAWGPATDPFDLVVGNPPFQNQLERRTARDRGTARELRERFGDVVVGYVDTASLFLVAACRLLRPGGRAALVVPQSFLAARDARPVRAALLDETALTGLWLPRAALFEASVRVCVPVLERGADPGAIERWTGADRQPARPWGCGEAPPARSWAPLAADLVGAPPITVETGSTLGNRATATAGFRDQFYGLVPFVDEGTNGNRSALLVTSGSIEPGSLAVGKPVRFAGSRYLDPRVDLERLEAGNERLAQWGRARLVPKVLVATQSRVLEAVVDEEGTWWPSVPVIAVHVGDVGELWRVAAAINSPFATAWACHRAAGAALSDSAIKLSAAQVLELPLPRDREAWDDGAELLRRVGRESDPERQRGTLLEFGEVMGAAYGVDAEVREWWAARLPKLAGPPRVDLPLPG